MKPLFYALGDEVIALHLHRTAKKNIILRARDTKNVQLNMPPWLTQRALLLWLDTHQALLHKVLAQAPLPIGQDFRLPERIWWQGGRVAVAVHDGEAIHDASGFRLPEYWTAAQQQAWLRDYFFQAAQAQLLPQLMRHSVRLNLVPRAINLSHAKTFWGVCRARTGIRLNWRLVGAPDFVQEYVCVHELCHLPHPNHSPAFWAAVNAATNHTDTAKAWLKAHGRELFVLG